MFVHFNVNFPDREKGNQPPFEEIYQSEKSHFPRLGFTTGLQVTPEFQIK